jgi:hypothetical protein
MLVNLGEIATFIMVLFCRLPHKLANMQKFFLFFGFMAITNGPVELGI